MTTTRPALVLVRSRCGRHVAGLGTARVDWRRLARRHDPRSDDRSRPLRAARSPLGFRPHRRIRRHRRRFWRTGDLRPDGRSQPAARNILVGHSGLCHQGSGVGAPWRRLHRHRPRPSTPRHRAAPRRLRHHGPRHVAWLAVSQSSEADLLLQPLRQAARRAVGRTLARRTVAACMAPLARTLTVCALRRDRRGHRLWCRRVAPADRAGPCGPACRSAGGRPWS